MNQPCAHWARSWHSHYGVRRNPGIFFMSFYTSKNNFKKFLKSCPILSLPIQSIPHFFVQKMHRLLSCLKYQGKVLQEEREDKKHEYDCFNG